MANGFRHFAIATIIIGLFAVALFNFAILLPEQAGSTSPLRQDPRINGTLNNVIGEIEGNLSARTSDSRNSKSVLESEDPQLTDQGLSFKSATSAGKLTLGGTIELFTAVSAFVFSVIFGSPFGLAFTTLSTLLLLTVLFYFVKWLRSGDPD